jgi:hypothetical protein
MNPRMPGTGTIIAITSHANVTVRSAYRSHR